MCEILGENSNDIARKISNEIKKSINRIQECGEELKNDASEECMRDRRSANKLNQTKFLCDL